MTGYKSKKAAAIAKTIDEALQMCFEYIETNAHERRYVRWAIKEALALTSTECEAQPAQEPVATTAANHVAGEIGYCQFHAVVPSGTDLYTTPPQRTWVGLTENEIDQGLLRTNYAMQTANAWRDGVEWASKQLQEKNT
jgi:hypothetical protein